MIGSIVGLIFTYFISSLIVMLFFARIANAQKQDAAKLFFLSLGAGPIFVSWVLRLMLSVAPGREDVFYVVSVVAFFVLISLFALKKISLLTYLYSELKQSICKFSVKADWCSVLIVLFSLCAVAVIWIVSLLPVREHDALQYLTVARMIYEQKSVAFYPVVNPDPATGFYAASAHPLGYITLIVWSYILQGGAEVSGLAKIIAPAYNVILLLVLFYFLQKRGRLAAALGMLFMLGVPVYLRQCSFHSIDLIRIYTFFVFFLYLAEIVRGSNYRQLVVAGLLGGLTLFTHTLSILVLPYSALLYFLISRKPWRRRIVDVAVFCSIAFAFGGFRFVMNIVQMGTPLVIAAPIFDMVDTLQCGEYFIQARGFGEWQKRLTNGVLLGFTRPRVFGSVYWIFLFSSLLYCRVIYKDLSLRVSAGVIVLFYAMILALAFVGDGLNIGHSRYYLTVHPFMAYVSAVSLSQLLPKLKKYRYIAVVLLCFLFIKPIVFETGRELGRLCANIDESNTRNLKESCVPIARSRRLVERLLGICSTYCYVVRDDWLGYKHLYSRHCEVLRYAREETPEDSVFLVLRQNDFAYYARRRFIRHLDPRLIDFYRIKDKEEAYAALCDLGVDYIYMPSYMMPTFFNSMLYKIVADPGITVVVAEDTRTRLYKVAKKRRPVEFRATDFKFSHLVNSSQENGRLPDGWTLFSASAGFDLETFKLHEGSEGNVLEVWNDTKGYLQLYTGSGSIGLASSSFFGEAILGVPGGRYRMQIDLEGRGILYVFAYEYDKFGFLLQSCQLWESALAEDGRPVEVLYRFGKLSREFRLGLLLSPGGRMKLLNIDVALDSSAAVVGEPDVIPQSWQAIESFDFDSGEAIDVKTKVWSVFRGDYGIAYEENCLAYSEDGYDGGSCLNVKATRDTDYWICCFDEAHSANLVALDKQKEMAGYEWLRLSGQIKGRGSLDVFVRWRMSNGGTLFEELGRYNLGSDYGFFDRSVKIPNEALGYDVAFKLAAFNADYAQLFVDDITVYGGRESSPAE